MKIIDTNSSDMYVRAVIYGLPGSGKTRLLSTAASAESTAPSLMLEAAGNPLSIRDYTQKPDIIQVERLEDLNAPYDWIMRGQPKDDPLVSDFGLKPPYKSLIMDQLTEIQRMYFDRVLGMRTVKPGDIPPKREWEHYNKVLGAMVNIARLYLKSLPIHVFAACQEREGDERTGRLLGPMLEGQSVGEINSYVYIVGRIRHISTLEPLLRRVVEKEHPGSTFICFFKPSSEFMAKDQYYRLGDYMVDPTVGRMMELILE